MADGGEQGVPPAAAQRPAGHASIAITLEVHTHLDAGDLDAAVDAALPLRRSFAAPYGAGDPVSPGKADGRRIGFAEPIR